MHLLYEIHALRSLVLTSLSVEAKMKLFGTLLYWYYYIY